MESYLNTYLNRYLAIDCIFITAIVERRERGRMESIVCDRYFLLRANEINAAG